MSGEAGRVRYELEPSGDRETLLHCTIPREVSGRDVDLSYEVDGLAEGRIAVHFDTKAHGKLGCVELDGFVFPDGIEAKFSKKQSTFTFKLIRVPPQASSSDDDRDSAAEGPEAADGCSDAGSSAPGTPNAVAQGASGAASLSPDGKPPQQRVGGGGDEGDEEGDEDEGDDREDEEEAGGAEPAGGKKPKKRRGQRKKKKKGGAKAAEEDGEETGAGEAAEHAGAAAAATDADEEFQDALSEGGEEDEPAAAAPAPAKAAGPPPPATPPAAAASPRPPGAAFGSDSYASHFGDEPCGGATALPAPGGEPLAAPASLVQGPAVAACLDRHEVKGEDKGLKVIGGTWTPAGSSVPVSFSAFGIFDGHGGKPAATFASKELLPTVMRLADCCRDGAAAAAAASPGRGAASAAAALEAVAEAGEDGESWGVSVSREDRAVWAATEALVDRLPKALFAGFLEADKTCRARHKASGTTATLAVAVGWELLVANVGDSAAYLDTGREVLAVTGNHRLDDNAAERARVKAAGGEVAKSCADGVPVGPDRVWPGGLAMSRSIGDPQAPQVVAVPEVRHVTLPTTGARLVIASDGVWDHMQPKSMIHQVRGDNTEAAARKLSLAALRKKGARDDVSVLVADFLPRAPAAPRDSRPPGLDVGAARAAVEACQVGRPLLEVEAAAAGGDGTAVAEASTAHWREEALGRRAAALTLLRAQAREAAEREAAEEARLAELRAKAEAERRVAESVSDTYLELTALRLDPEAVRAQLAAEQRRQEEEAAAGAADDGGWTTVRTSSGGGGGYVPLEQQLRAVAQVQPVPAAKQQERRSGGGGRGRPGGGDRAAPAEARGDGARRHDRRDGRERGPDQRPPAAAEAPAGGELPQHPEGQQGRRPRGGEGGGRAPRGGRLGGRGERPPGRGRGRGPAGGRFGPPGDQGQEYAVAPAVAANGEAFGGSDPHAQQPEGGRGGGRGRDGGGRRGRGRGGRLGGRGERHGAPAAPDAAAADGQADAPRARPHGVDQTPGGAPPTHAQRPRPAHGAGGRGGGRSDAGAGVPDTSAGGGGAATAGAGGGDAAPKAVPAFKIVPRPPRRPLGGVPDANGVGGPGGGKPPAANGAAAGGGQAFEAADPARRQEYYGGGGGRGGPPRGGGRFGGGGGGRFGGGGGGRFAGGGGRFGGGGGGRFAGGGGRGRGGPPAQAAAPAAQAQTV